jgi:hypothetical protein
MISKKHIALVMLVLMILASAVMAQTQPTHFTFTAQTGTNATVAIPTTSNPNIAGTPLSNGDEIGAFSPAGLCVGAVVWSGGTAVLTVWGDNGMTPAVDGIASGQPISYRIWEKATGIEYAAPILTYDVSNPIYIKDGLFVGNGIYMILALATPPSRVVHTISGFLVNTTTHKYSFSIYSRSTGSAAVHVGSTTYSFSYNTTALNAPVLSNVNPKYTAGSPTGDYSAMGVGLTGGKLVVSITYTGGAGHTGDVLATTSPNGELICTVTLTITNNAVPSGLMWDVLASAMSTPAIDPITNLFQGTGDVPLPVEIRSFNAAPATRGVLLSWTTATEKNNFGFDVERSATGGKGWQKIGFVEGSGTSNAPKTYSFMDRILTAGTFAYRLKQIDRDGNFNYSNCVQATVAYAPVGFELAQNTPNPFNPSTRIGFNLPEEALTRLSVYTLLGQHVATLVNTVLPAGHQSVTFDASALAGGMYLYRLEAGTFTQVKKMILLK